MSYDLTLQADPDRIDPEVLSRLNSELAASSALAHCEVSRGEADPIGDLELLEEAFQEHEASRAAYAEYCRARQVDPGSDEAANSYLEKLWGRPLLTVYLQADPVLASAAFGELRRIAAALELQLYDPQAGEGIDASYSGSLPPRF